MSGVIVSQLGARMHYAVPRILHAHGRLAHFYTDVCASRALARAVSAAPARAVPQPLRRLAGRVPAGLPAGSVTTFADVGMGFALRRALARTPTEQTAAHLRAGRELSRRVVRRLLRRGVDDADGVFGYSGECLELLTTMKRHGLRTTVEQIVAPKRLLDRLILEEEERFPGWSEISALDALSEEYAERERAEWQVADLVLCGSPFVRDGVVANGGDPRRCVVAPYGVETRIDARLRTRSRASGPLRVLTAGQIGLRKGSPYVLETARRLRGHAEFRMVGACDVGPAGRAALADATTLTGAAPRAEMRAHYDWADVFLLPSVCEGSATVVYEALASGLPVVTTPNAGSVVRDGMDGFIVPIRDVDAIETALRRLTVDCDLYTGMARNALGRGREFDLAGYGRRLLEAIGAGEALTHGPFRLAAAG